MPFVDVLRGVVLTVLTATAVVRAVDAQQLQPVSIPGAPRAQKPDPVRAGVPALSPEASAKAISDKATAREALLAACRYMTHTPPVDDIAGLDSVTARISALEHARTLDVTDTSPDVTVPSEAAGRTPWAIAACSDILHRQVVAFVEDGKPAEKQNAKHKMLVELDFTLSRLSKWLNAWARKNVPGGKADAAVLTALANAQDRIQPIRQDTADLMRKHDLLNPFSAAFIAGTATGGSGRLIGLWGDDAVRNRISERESTLQYTRLTVESAHFGWQGEHGVDFSVRAHAGYQPVQALLQAKTETAKTAATVAVLQQALVFSTGFRFGVPMQRSSSELSFVANLGAARPTTDAVTFDDKQPPLVATAAKDGASATASFAELGAEFAMFDNPVRVLHAEKGLVTPAVVLAAGYRRDSRFLPGGFDTVTGLDVSPNRLYARFMVDAVKTISPRKVAGAPKAFDLGFGLEYERNMFRSTSMVPSTTRFFVRGSLNLLKAAANEQEGEGEDAAPGTGGKTPTTTPPETAAKQETP